LISIRPDFRVSVTKHNRHLFTAKPPGPFYGFRLFVIANGGDGIPLRFKSSTLDFPKDLACGGCLPTVSIALGLAFPRGPQIQILENQSGSAPPAPSGVQQSDKPL